MRIWKMHAPLSPFYPSKLSRVVNLYQHCISPTVLCAWTLTYTLHTHAQPLLSPRLPDQGSRKPEAAAAQVSPFSWMPQKNQPGLGLWHCHLCLVKTTDKLLHDVRTRDKLLSSSCDLIVQRWQGGWGSVYTAAFVTCLLNQMSLNIIGVS